MDEKLFEVAETTEQSGGSMVAYFVLYSRELGRPTPSKRILSRIGQEAKELLDEGVAPNDVKAGIELLIERKWRPVDLPDAVFVAQGDPERGRFSAQDKAMLKRFLEEHGGRYPTGSRWVRTLQAGVYKRDPLGYDTPEYKVEWGRPTKGEIIAALKRAKSPGPPPSPQPPPVKKLR